MRQGDDASETGHAPPVRPPRCRCSFLMAVMERAGWRHNLRPGPGHGKRIDVYRCPRCGRTDTRGWDWTPAPANEPAP